MKDMVGETYLHSVMMINFLSILVKLITINITNDK